MKAIPLPGIRACVFDAYGTLFDHASAAAGCGELLGERLGPFNALWREKQLQYTWLRASQGRHADFWQVTGDALDFVMDSFEIAAPALRERLMHLYLTPDIFPDVALTLARLKTAGFKIAILSNGSPAMLSAAVEGSNIAHLFDAVLSVEEVGAYKPHPSVYRLAVERLNVESGAIAFSSSNAWDAYAASAFGMRVVWCNRYGQKRERLPGNPDQEIRSLEEFPPLVGA
jgi:2-haloacid dehalogenase